MAGADDIVPDVSFAQDEADYEAALMAGNPGGNNPQQSELPEFTTATPPGYKSISYSYQLAAPEHAAPRQPASSQFEDPTQYSPAPTAVSSFRADPLRGPRAPTPGDLGFTPQEIDTAHPLELGLENLLRQCDVKEAVIQAFRVRGITDRLLFVALDDTNESLHATCKEAFGSRHFSQFRAYTGVRKDFKGMDFCQSDSRNQTENRQFIEVTENQYKLANMILAFKLKYGKQIHPSRLPAQSYYKAYEEKLANTSWKVETLPHVISLQEEDKQKSLRPEPSRSVGIHLDSSLSIQTQRWLLAKMPTNVEEATYKMQINGNHVPPREMRQPSRHLCGDPEVNAFSDFLDEL